MSFETNQGQTDNLVKFFSRGQGYGLFLTSAEAVLVLSKKQSGTKPESAVVRMQVLDTNPVSEPQGVEDLPGKANYLIGDHPAKWRTNIPTYAKVRYPEVYSGIDLLYYGKGRQLEFDFEVAPGADPNVIRIGFKANEEVRIDGEGDLVVKAGGEEIRLHKPVAYQRVGGKRQEITAEYALLDNQNVAFKVGRYNVREPLVIDPVLSYSTYLGDASPDYGYGVAVDGLGNAYVTGITRSTNFPTVNPLQPGYGGGFSDAFVAKLNAGGSALLYSTYLGGADEENSTAIAVDGLGNAYVTGKTLSTNFPTVSPLQATNGGMSDAFVAKLNAAGSALLYSTYLGGRANESNFGTGIAVDGSGNAYVTGDTRSTNFPLVNPLQTVLSSGAAFVSKLNAAGSALHYSTYLGGSDFDVGTGIAIDGSGHAYVTGYTLSLDFPTERPLQAQCRACRPLAHDAFVSKLSPAGSALVYSTYLGGDENDIGRDIAVDSLGNAYVTGETSSPNFPTVHPLQPGLGGSYDAFVAKLNAAGSAFIYSTYLGGGRDDLGFGIAADWSGNAYLTGYTSSTDFPIVRAGQPHHGGGGIDAFVTKLNAVGSALFYSTFLGSDGGEMGHGIAVDSSENAYVTGETTSPNFPTANPLQPVCGSCPDQPDAFVAKIPKTFDVVP